MGQAILHITEDGYTNTVGDIDDLPDPAHATVDQILASIQKHPTQGWRFYKNDEGGLAVDMEWMGIESPRRPEHLKRRPGTIIFPGLTANLDVLDDEANADPEQPRVTVEPVGSSDD